jgi:DNA sulfur modification protein DndB
VNHSFSYNFPALRGKQGGKEYYVVMCPLRLIPKIFLFDEEEISPEHRAQRILNKIRIPEITNYIVENPSDYVFSSLTASIDGDIEFIPFSNDQHIQDLGQLHISLDSKFLINDGQHRRAAIEEAIKISPELGNETISVVFFHDQGLRNSQQIFSDLNRHAINTTSSIGILYDHRDRLAMVTKGIVEKNELLRRYTDLEKVNLSQNSPKIIALNHIFNTNLRLIGKTKGYSITDDEAIFLQDFWKLLCESIVEWNMVLNKKLSPRDLRINYIVGHGVFIESVGLVGRYLREHHVDYWQKYIIKLAEVDFSRANKADWLGRAFSVNGRIQKTRDTVTLTANKIKERLGLPLTELEQKIEEKFQLGE